MLFMHVKQEFSFETSKDNIEKYLVNLFYVLKLSLINKNVHNYLKNSLIYEAFYKEILDPKNNKNILINPEAFDLTIKEYENYWIFFKKENIEFWNQNFAKTLKDKKFKDFFEEQKITSNWIQRYSNINKIFFFFPKIIDNNIDHSTFQIVKGIFQIKIKPIYLSKIEFNLIQKIEHDIIPNMIHNINKELHIIKIENYQTMLKKRKEFNSFKKKFIIQPSFRLRCDQSTSVSPDSMERSL
jgi:hypothetical protein